VLVLAYRLLPPASSGRRPPLDLIGVAGISGGLALALIPLILGRSEHWPVWAWVMLAAAVPVTAGALRYEQRLGRRGGNPLVDLTLFRIRTFSAGLATAVAFMAFFTSSIFVLSLFLQTGLGLSPLRGGLSFAPFALLAMVTALTGPKLIARHGAPTVIRAGCLISATGTVLVELYLTTAGGSVAVGWLVAELGLIGAGNSLILTAYLGAALSAVKREQAGIASGTLNTIQQFAGTGGLAIIGAIFFSCLGTHPGRDQYAHATGIALWIGLGLIAAIALLTRSLTSRPPSDQSTTSATRSAVSVSTAVDGQVGG
jgi:branched-subunit amino acid transport protein